VTSVNEFIYKHSTQDKFISMVVIVLSPEEGGISFCNAGHNPPFLLRRDGTSELFETGGMPVGVFPDQKYGEGQSVLLPGETVVLYTDGLTEARNSEDEEFGMDHLIEIARLNSDFHAHRLTEEIVKYIREKWLGTDQEDDWTLLVLKREEEKLEEAQSVE
jgi:phosphoserine phosphatase RsbU/P